jgi:hypothetical protein
MWTHSSLIRQPNLALNNDITAWSKAQVDDEDVQ